MSVKNKPVKSRRPGRRCPACGQIQGTVAERKATGHKVRALKRKLGEAPASEASATAEACGHGSPAAAETPATPVPEPLDPTTVIKGVAARVPEALEGAGVEDPPTPAAITAAVRRAVLDEFRTRSAFAGHLAEIDALLWGRAGESRDLAREILTGHLRELRLTRVTEPEESDRFVVTEGEGESFELLSPAYVDELTGKVILAGQLRRVAGEAGAETGEEA
jgi:hypothetical protein